MCSLRVRVARNGRLAAVAFAAILVLPPLTRAATVVIQPTNQDAFIQKNQPNRITGTKNTRLRVEASPLNTKVKRALVQFPLGAIPPGSLVTSAVIGLNASINAGSGTLTHGVHRVTAPWQENTVKWNNQPPFVATPSATALVGDGRGFKSFDVTVDVQSAVNLCSTDHGWLVKDVAETGSNLDVAYISQEEAHPADVPNRPRLVVEYTPPACVTDADCQDTNLCTVNEQCQAGFCVVQALSCDDGDACTTDVCDCGQGCRQQPICNDGLSCTTDTCDPATLECTNTPVDAACVTDCSTGTCVADPDDPDIEPETGCLIETTEPAGSPCSDGQSCTTPDECDGSGACVPGPKDCETPGCGTSPVCTEDCTNCVDDNENGLVDREDPKCTPLANGGGRGAGDPKFRGKPVLRCQKAIRAAGLQFANQLRSRLQKCTDGVFLCLQQKPNDPVCIAKAQSRCAKQTAAVHLGPTNLDQRLGAKIAKACGPKKPGLLPVVSGADLCGDTGLGFGHDVPLCGTPSSPLLLSAVTTTLAEEHRCRAVQLFATDVPRAGELLTAGGVDLSTLPCLLSGAAHAGLGSKPTAVLKAVVGCQRAIGTAGARFVKQVLAAEQRCAESVAQCLHTKPGDQKCLVKAQRVCRKVTGNLYTGVQSREAKLRSTIARSCGSMTPGKAPRVAFDDLRSLLGIGYDGANVKTTCQELQVQSLSSISDVSECVVRDHVCRADQLLTSQTPRARELLAIGGAIGR